MGQIHKSSFMVDFPTRLAMFGNFGGNEFMTTWRRRRTLGVSSVMVWRIPVESIISFTLMESFNQLLDKNVWPLWGTLNSMQCLNHRNKRCISCGVSKNARLFSADQSAPSNLRPSVYRCLDSVCFDWSPNLEMYKVWSFNQPLGKVCEPWTYVKGRNNSFRTKKPCDIWMSHVLRPSICFLA